MLLAIRAVTPSDVPTILRFIRDLAEYEREPQAVVATEEMIRAALFDEGHVAHGLIASVDGAPVGFAIYFFNFSTWLGRPGLYLEDLYVTPATRGSGIGRALLTRVAQIAVERDCGRMEWAVLNWNTPAIDFYRAMGAKPLDEWTVYRLTGEMLRKAAAQKTVCDPAEARISPP
jgi:GNAT superfamily N-acetyltransferase